ncbi:BMP family ABC transporter substrate-binding protein [Borrelia miyamotoi]|uniref:BMP family protein n=1 Tax=Borrelia miyamotoi TaxID=47466 RepID=A0AAP8YUQ9_9SPIR|nr:BMP family protein [Borrelia miyamotoi]AHH05035.1 Basic membrane protein A precursor [Borrelia miyamotoi FR64b]ATQ14833.1 BMP family protein [Borrelia miyamotoi]ATQ16015.1 BMP family protein [Borrelia miyamotoi]ATQ17161.1 BMP family protein [Borrelia miyamotoi]ATQ18333.1 BMP family protein [Borrelia miyamotoi]
MRNLFLALCILCFSCSGSKVDGRLAKIAVLIDGTFDDNAFNGSVWNGVKKLEKEFGLEIVMKESSSDSYLFDVKSLKDNGSNFIWLVGYKFSDLAIIVASENPGIKYAIIDPVYNRDLIIPENLSAITFRSEECAFLVGYIAAKTSKTGKIGFLGGVDDIVVNAFRYGYEAGAMYANKNISIDSKYIGSFVDTYTGKKMTNEMYANGVDIIYHIAGLVGLGIIEAAKELGDGYYIIGVGQDQSHLAPENVITSSIKDIGRVLNIVTSNYLRTNMFEGGKLLNYGLKEGFLGFVKNPKEISFELERELDHISEMIINGDIIVPNNEKTYNSFLRKGIFN